MSLCRKCSVVQGLIGNNGIKVTMLADFDSNLQSSAYFAETSQRRRSLFRRKLYWKYYTSYLESQTFNKVYYEVLHIEAVINKGCIS